MSDAVDDILSQWQRERPDLDPSPMGIFGRIARLAVLQREASEERLAEYGINAAEFDVLATLLRSGPPYSLTPGRLARSAMVTTGGMTGRINRLEAKGLVARDGNEADRRSIRVRLTEEGKRTTDAAVGAHLAAESSLLESLSDSERARLTALLAKLTGGR
jgi:DNA-binding MarR family transcriptional regulator